jgi:hypothetical protein
MNKGDLNFVIFSKSIMNICNMKNIGTNILRFWVITIVIFKVEQHCKISERWGEEKNKKKQG